MNTGCNAPIFKIFGDLFHFCGPLLPAPECVAKYAQLYIYDPQAALVDCASINNSLDWQILCKLQNMLSSFNPYTSIFRYACDVLADQVAGVGSNVISACLHTVPGTHSWLGNLPSADEVAVVICDSGGEEPNPKDIVLYRFGGTLEIINDLNAAYTPLYYVLLFPQGEPGWYPELEMYEFDANNIQLHRQLSQACYVAFRLQVQPNEFSTILHSK